MKRISELEENAKRVCQEADEEIARIKAADSFIPLLNATLAEWKAKLRTAASQERKDWKLVIYSFEDTSLLQDGRHTYDPKIFSEDPWLVEDWSQVQYRSGEATIAAFADTPEALLPKDNSLRFLGCFKLPFAVMPSWLEHPTRIQDMYWNAEQFAYAYGLVMIWHINRPISDLSAIAGIEKPDPANPEHIKAIYSSKWNPAQMPHSFEDKLKELETERQQLLRKMEYYQVAINLKNKLLREPYTLVVCRGQSWIMSDQFIKPTFAEVYNNVESHFSHKLWKFYADSEHTVEITDDAGLLKCPLSGDPATPTLTLWVKSQSNKTT